MGSEPFPMCNKHLDMLNQRAQQVNRRLNAMARQQRQLHVIAHHCASQFAVDGKIQRHLLSRDGLHLSQRGTSTLVEDIERGIRGPSPAPPSQHPTSPTPPHSGDQTPYMTAFLRTNDVARISSDKTDEEEWPALPEVKYAPISPSLPTSYSSHPSSPPPTSSRPTYSHPCSFLPNSSRPSSGPSSSGPTSSDPSASRPTFCLTPTSFSSRS